MYLHPETIYQFAVGEQTAETQEQLHQLVDYLLLVWDNEEIDFSNKYRIEINEMLNTDMRQDYAYYLADLLLGLRTRMLEKQQKMKDEGTFDRMALFLLVANAFDNIEQSEWSNAKQLAQLRVVRQFRQERPGATIVKRWVAHAGACEKCLAMDGIEVPIDEPFLVAGQEVRPAEGEAFIYDYVSRDVAVMHPRDRCRIEFIILY